MQTSLRGIAEKSALHKDHRSNWKWPFEGRSTQANNFEEPGAGILHAGVCEGAVG